MILERVGVPWPSAGTPNEDLEHHRGRQGHDPRRNKVEIAPGTWRPEPPPQARHGQPG